MKKYGRTISKAAFPALLLTLVLAGFGVGLPHPSDEEFFPDFADRHTVVLWPFDETGYPHVTLTDASQNQYDLMLMQGGELREGKFGNALHIRPGGELSVSYSAPPGNWVNRYMRNRRRDGEPTGLWAATVAPGGLTRVLQGEPWTIEFWIKVNTPLPETAVLVDVGHGYERGFTLELIDHGAGFLFTNAYGGFAALCSTSAPVLASGRWRHVAFTFDQGLLVHYLNGRRQSTGRVSAVVRQSPPDVISPEVYRENLLGFSWKSPLEWKKTHRFNISLGKDRRGASPVDSAFDEVRVSDVVRYREDFALPDSLTYSFGPGAPGTAAPSAGPLLFSWPPYPDVIDLGSRRHLFIDELLIETNNGFRLTSNPPMDRTFLNFQPDDPDWRPTVMDVDGKVYMYCPDGYGAPVGLTHLRVSEDGVNFEVPDLGIFEDCSDCVLYRVPSYGTFFEDTNPAARSWERYKYTAWVSNRGIYLYVSPDGIHWRRNECGMLPIVSGGAVETFWDDQLGLYRTFVRRDTSFFTREGPGGSNARRECMFETDSVTKMWPFHRLRDPYFEGWPFPALTGEGPIVFDANANGQVYRARVIKYPWAPDVYLAFVWRFRPEDETRRVDLGVSRNGSRWRFFADEQWYVEPGEFEEVLSIYGLIRRGDEIWQYADYGGAHGRDEVKRRYARFRQRLDGFTSLDAGRGPATLTTSPFTFTGSRLTLNLSGGMLRAEIQDPDGRPLPGFTLEDCDPIRADSVDHTVTWNSRSDVSRLAGKVVRLQFAASGTKLYAIQFR